MTDEDSVHKAFRPGQYAPGPGAGREESPEERDGVPDTDTTAATPLGVGESINQRGEELADPERDGTQGASGRPYATGTADESGVAPGRTANEGAPDLATGDQGG